MSERCESCGHGPAVARVTVTTLGGTVLTEETMCCACLSGLHCCSDEDVARAAHERWMGRGSVADVS